MSINTRWFYVASVSAAFSASCTLSQHGVNSPQPISTAPALGAAASTSGWAVCLAEVSSGDIEDHQGQISGPFDPFSANPPFINRRWTVISNVFKWSGSEAGLSAQFDRYLAAQNAHRPALPPPLDTPAPTVPPSRCHVAATLEQVLSDPVITEFDWPDVNWPPNSLPQGWGVCFIEPAPGLSSILYHSDAFKWVGDQTSYRESFVEYVKSKYQSTVSSQTVSCAFQSDKPETILSIPSSETAKAANQGWSLVKVDWGNE